MIGRFFHSHIFKFCIVGGAGYIVDVCFLKLAQQAGMDAYSGQVVAFIGASMFTWIANRFWTFSDRRGGRHIGREWLRYFGVTIGGFCVNYAAYATMVTVGGIWEKHLFLAVAVGSLAGLIFNFPMSKYLVFSSASSALKEDNALSPDP